MKVVAVLSLALGATATALAFGYPDVSAGVSAVAARTATDPLALFLSGSALLGLAGAVRRLPF